MFKNLNIRQLTFYLTSAIIVGNVAILISFYFLAQSVESPYIKVIIVLVACVINMFLIWYLLERFVFRQIKLIYKIIREVRLSKKEKKNEQMGLNTFKSVGEEVEEWAKDTRNELEALKSLEEYRKNYVGNISHELKTPIFSIQGYLHTLYEGGLFDNNINQKYLGRAIDNLERLQGIVEDLESISKLESDAKKLDIKKLEIKPLVKEVFEDLQAMAKERNVSLIFKENAAPPFTVMADKESIRQVMNNLIVNSIKYSNEAGTTKVSFYDMGTQILVEISDNGPGIEEKHLKHLFDRFYRVDSSRSRKVGGSGLGLAIVKHIVEAHGQTVSVRSTLDVGSTFAFTLEKA